MPRRVPYPWPHQVPFHPRQIANKPSLPYCTLTELPAPSFALTEVLPSPPHPDSDTVVHLLTLTLASVV